MGERFLMVSVAGKGLAVLHARMMQSSGVFPAATWTFSPELWADTSPRSNPARFAISLKVPQT
jgi:hypothetical protein